MSTASSGPSQSLREHSGSGKSHPEATPGLRTSVSNNQISHLSQSPGCFLWFLRRFCLFLRDGMKQDLEIAWAFNENGLIADKKNRPLSALILNLGGRPDRTWQNVPKKGSRPRSSAIPPKPRSCPESPVSPIISAGRENGFWKIGGLSDRPSRRVSGVFTVLSTM